MPDRTPAAFRSAPSVADCPAVAEIAEFARRNPLGNFSLAHARAVTAALLRPAATRDPKMAAPATSTRHRS